MRPDAPSRRQPHGSHAPHALGDSFGIGSKWSSFSLPAQPPKGSAYQGDLFASPAQHAQHGTQHAQQEIQRPDPPPSHPRLALWPPSSVSSHSYTPTRHLVTHPPTRPRSRSPAHRQQATSSYVQLYGKTHRGINVLGENRRETDAHGMGLPLREGDRYWPQGPNWEQMLIPEGSSLPASTHSSPPRGMPCSPPSDSFRSFGYGHGSAVPGHVHSMHSADPLSMHSMDPLSTQSVDALSAYAQGFLEGRCEADPEQFGQVRAFDCICLPGVFDMHKGPVTYTAFRPSLSSRNIA